MTDCLTEGSERTSFSPGADVPCVDGKQTWTGYYFPGLLTDTSKVDFVEPKKSWKVPANLHVGCMGLAPSEVDFADSVPPMPYGALVLSCFQKQPPCPSFCQQAHTDTIEAIDRR